jgi:hydrazine synthase alpha subunit-like protein
VAAALAVVAAWSSLSPVSAQRASTAAEAPMVVAQVPAAAGASVTSAEGGRLVLVSPGGKVRVLTASFHSAADPDVSFDGRSILFAAKKTAADPWCVFEMKAEGSEARQITCGAAGARQPVYLTTVYTITPTSVEPWVQVAFVGEDPGERDEAGKAPHTSLWSCKMDGSALRRLTFNLSSDRDPVILPDGRMVYAGWLRSPGPEPADRVALLGVNEDGTDYQVYSGDEGLRAKRAPVPTAGGLVLFVESDRVDFDASGRLAAVSQRRPLHTYRSLTSETDGLFHAPSALPDGRVLVAWRPASGEGRFAICRLDPSTGAREKVFEDPAWHSLQAKGIAPRPVADSRSSVVRDDDPEGTFFTIDVGIQAPGRALPKGTARILRVVEGVAATAERPVVRRLLGEVPLAEDGSYQVRVPANTPVQLELLDASGAPVRASGWVWVRNHAQQGCVGCHEDPERTPPNRLMKALSAPAPVLNPPPENRAPLADAPGGAGGAGCPRGSRAGLEPSAAEVLDFVQSLEAGGKP